MSVLLSCWLSCSPLTEPIPLIKCLGLKLHIEKVTRVDGRLRCEPTGERR
jgi:hypothetical protein